MRTHGLPSGIGLLSVLLFALVPCAFALAQTDAPDRGVQAQPTDPPATLRIFHRDLVTFRVTMLGYTPLQRVDGAVLRIIEAGRQNRHPVVDVFDIPEGAQVRADGNPLFVVVEGDVNRLGGETPQVVAARAAEQIEIVIRELGEREDPRALAVGAGLAVAATLTWILVLRILTALARRAILAVARKSENVSVSGKRVFDQATLFALARRLFRLLAVTLGIVATYAWLNAVLSAFPHTRPWGERQAGMVVDTLASIGLGMLEALPGLFFIVVIVVIASVVLKAAGALFDHVRRHNVHLGVLNPDTARPMQMIVSLVVGVFAMAMAYPYLPGSDSRALQGLTVLLGLMVSIGASGTVGHAVSGLILMFTGAFRVGEHVRIGDAEGTVVELGLFVTRLRSGMGDEIQLPNTLVLASASTNYSRAGPEGGFLLDVTVTIGYDVPWRQVCAMLLEAAARTPDVSAEPAPRVMQAALDDFYVRYRLVAYSPAKAPYERAEALGRLNGNIQDVFNANGVQIMSPHYLGDPAQAKVVPRERWHAVTAPVPGDGPPRS